MKTGDLKHKIEFQRLKNVLDDEGFPTDNQKYDTFLKVYAAVNNLYGKEKEAVKQNISETIVVFHTRYFRNIDEECYILFKGQRYEIIEPPDNIKYLNKELKIKAKLQKVQNGN
ncbi:phage head closure protein [Clostridium sp. YIM B02551]|uniref:phage head closure protein n=1 Tax=Clostridium sp. YIM B02551 TaxID=2910679 RepID=UPI001EEC23C0